MSKISKRSHIEEKPQRTQSNIFAEDTEGKVMNGLSVFSVKPP
jgi:hypothetical protein